MLSVCSIWAGTREGNRDLATAERCDGHEVVFVPNAI
jgi:hypothetical protein